jgi:uncharacterized protein (DUF1499 family)
VLLTAVGLLHSETDAAEPGASAPCPPRPNCVSSRAGPGDAQHHVPPFALRGDVDAAWARVRARARALPRATVVEDSPSRLRLVVRSLVFRFPDDLELALDGAARRVEVRSASRYGYGDFGVNRRRVEGLRDMLRQEGSVE